MPELPAVLLSIHVHFLLVTVLNMPPCSLSQTPLLSSVRMAAILDDRSACGRGERLALALARENINSVLEGPARARVDVEVFELQKDSQYETTDTMCQILPKGVVAVIGPASSPASGSTVSHICGEKEIPHVKIGPEETPRLPYLRFASVTLYPSNEDLSLAVGAILRSFSYPSASLVCAKAECLLRLEELVRRFLISRETLSVRMLDDDLDPTSLLKEIRDDKIATIIIDANASVSYLILKKASELGMTSAFYKYILTTMDFPLLWLDDVVDEHSNIVGFSMFNTTHPFYLEFIRSLNLSWREGCDLNPYPGPALSSALLFDAVHVVASAVQELNRSQEIGVKPLSCSSPQIWQHGTSLMNYLRMVEYDGLTGRVEFNSKGQRTNYTLHILEKHKSGHKQIGIWYSNNTLVMNSTSLDINVSETLANKTLIVTTILENPYVMRKANYQELEGNEQYEGFCVDMLKELSDILKFTFRIKLVDDGLYGAPEPNGSWTGMVGELINRKADLAVAAFTITSEREKVIDFSKPFMTLGISILYRVHIGRKPGYFSFLDPFSPAVWLFMLLAYLAVSCVLFLAARLSPYEWYNPHPCLRERRDLLENQYTLGNSLWFPVGGFMQQGSEIMPKALSTRCVSGVWWAFTLIIISSYTANLAAFLTVQRMEVPIESPDDLADQTNIQYGTIHGGSTMTFFMNSRYQTYQRMWNYMYSKQPSVFVKSTEEGIARVLNSKYAFLLESTMNEYHRSLNCNLTQIGGLLDTKGYGIGMPLGSPFRDEISLAVLQLQENNRLEILKRRWWEGGQCPKEEDHRAKGLGMENIGGIFVVLICGLIIAVFVAVMEFVWSTRRSAETDEVSVCQEMLSEFRNAVSCKKSSRLRRRRPLSSSLALRHPARLSLGASRPLRLVREMRLSNGKLYSGAGPLTGGAGGAGGPSELGPGPQRLLEEPLGAKSTPAGPLGPPAVTVPLPRGCTHDSNHK
ncbi:glutamate receptor ionotropic, kainate 5, partial [Clarias magur]